MSKTLEQPNVASRYLKMPDEYNSMSRSTLENMRQDAIEQFDRGGSRLDNVKNALSMRVSAGTLNQKYGTLYEVPDLESMVSKDFPGLDKSSTQHVERIRGDHSVGHTRRLPNCPSFEEETVDSMELQ